MLFLLIVLCFVVCIIVAWPSNRKTKLINKFNGPPALPLLGNGLLCLTIKKEDMLLTAKDYCEKYGSAFRLWFVNDAYVIINDPKYIEVILNNTNNIEKGLFYNTLKSWLNNGLLISTGSKWQYRRKLLTSAFHFKILEDSLQTFNKNSQFLVKQLLKSNENLIEIEPLISRCTLDMICEAAMGVSLSDLSDKGEEYVKAINRVSNLIMCRMVSPWLWNDWIYYLTSNGREYFKILSILHNFTKMIIKERKQRKTSDHSRKEKQQLKTFLDCLLDLNETDPDMLNFEGIKEEVDTFMFEGHDTSAAAISSAIFILGHNPNIQELLFKELDEVFGDSDRGVTMEDLNQLSYLDRVIKEVLRLFPSVPALMRKIQSDIQLGHEENIIPPTTNVTILPYVLHRNPKYYPDPEKFNPDRFLPEEIQKRHPFAYIPFSAGPRNCIGQKFAKIEIKVVLSSILRKMRVQSITKLNEVKPEPGVILKSAAPYIVQLIPRK
ncbi:cytochrome P450 4C1-like [Lycorma delicatula]|uniref:cytochrome P450 4C1-like n=1 Tax=Lycorma delicatula TaxID=130591 RepID=UPI003F50EFA2